MKLLQLRVVDLGPFADVVVSFRGPEEQARNVTIVVGGSGVGKTTLLAAIASTRPAHAVATMARAQAATPGYVIADWDLSDDDPERPHPLQVCSPHTPVKDTEEDRLRRREQTLFDRRAVEQGGFMVMSMSSTRWFSRTSVSLSSPERTVLRYDVRAAQSFDDASHADIARDVKLALVYAAIASRIPEPDSGRLSLSLAVVDEAMRDLLARLLALVSVRYLGVHPLTLEPVFATDRGEIMSFDRLPTSIRHLVAFAVLPVRALAAAYPGRDPRMTEGVVLIDEVALHQEPHVQRGIVTALRGALPRVQWILTTSSPEVAWACEPYEVIALRRMPSSRRVELFEGPLATLH